MGGSNSQQSWLPRQASYTHWQGLLQRAACSPYAYSPLWVVPPTVQSQFLMLNHLLGRVDPQDTCRTWRGREQAFFGITPSRPQLEEIL